MEKVGSVDVRSRLNGVFREVFQDRSIEIFDAMTAKDVEFWDSLTHINLIVAVEKNFNVSFTTREINGLKNVGDFIRLIGNKLS